MMHYNPYPSTTECDFIGNQVIADVNIYVNTRSYWSWVYPNHYSQCSYKKRKIHTWERKILCDDRERMKGYSHQVGLNPV